MGSVFLVLLSIIGIVTGPVDVDKLSTLTNETLTSLYDLFDDDGVSDLYKYYNATVIYEEGKGNETAVIQSIASSLSNMSTHIKEVLQDSVALADTLYWNETSSGCCSNDQTNEFCVGNNYYRSDIRLDEDFESSYNFLFARNVSFNSSAIHVPVDVRTNNTNVMCFIQWSSGLEDHFANQSADLPFGVTYQYFGSRDGVLRFYPSSQWSLLNQCYRCPVSPADTFDARQRPWYTNTISGSKFVVILIDMSGSMTGSRLILAQLAAKQILESLTPNDYFLVIKVADNNATGPLGCFTGRTRASAENILVITEVLQEKTETNGSTNFNSGVMQAFEALNNSSECYKVVVVITDKDVDHEQLNFAIKQHNMLILKVRVFIFLVGLGNNDYLKWIACDNGGRMYEVEDYNDILNSAQTFVNDLRHLTPPHSVDNIFWSHYRDVFGDLVLTGSLPLITNTTTDEIGEFLGVMGIDVSVKNIQDIFRKHIGCSTGYGFMTDNNGQIIVHPEVDYDYIKNTLSSDDLISLDISYFEHAQDFTDLELLRAAMINRESGNLTMAVWVPVDKKRRYLLRNVTYHYAPVENTPFSVAIALPSSEPQDFCVYSNFSVSERPSSNSGVATANTLLDDRESVYKYLHLALEEGDGEDVFSVYADPLGTVALQHSNMSVVRATFTNVMDAVLDKLLPTTDDGRNNTLLYLLDSNGFIVWMSDSEQLQMSGQRFNKFQPLVFDDMVNKSVFIVGTFMGYEPKPCKAYGMPHSVTTACLDSAASSMHKNFFLSLINFGLWLITEGLRMIALTTYHSMVGCIGSIYHLLSLSVGSAQSDRSTWDNSSCSCSLNLCLDSVTAVQLHPDFTNYVSGQIVCPGDNGATISYAAKKVEHTNLVLVEVHGMCSTQHYNRAHSAQYQSCLPCVCNCTYTDSVHQERVSPGFCSQYRRPMDQACHENTTDQNKYTSCSEVTT